MGFIWVYRSISPEILMQKKMEIEMEIKFIWEFVA